GALGRHQPARDPHRHRRPGGPSTDRTLHRPVPRPVGRRLSDRGRCMIRIAVVYGGRSGEHLVSCESAASILAHLDPGRYDVTEVKITTDGEWLVDGEPVGIAGALRAFGAVDVVFPALHGPYGEDGTIQSLLDFAGVPYVGNPVLASAAGMDKEITKKLLAAEGRRVADGVGLRPGDDDLTIADKLWLGLPVFVKPVRSGSSIGVTKVTDWADLPAAIAAARAHDGKVLVERAVAGREVDVGVLEHPDGRLVAGPPPEIRVDEGFFDPAAKHGHGAVLAIPARLAPPVPALL